MIRSRSLRARIRVVPALLALAMSAEAPSALADDALGPALPGPIDTPDLQRDDITLLPVPSLPPDFEAADKGWIRFAYPASERDRVQPIIDVASDARGALSSELGVDVLDHVDVRVARTPTELRAIAPRVIAPAHRTTAVAYVRARMIVLSIEAAQPSDMPDLTDMFRHELAHLALFDAVRGQPLPTWFQEGYASHASGQSAILRTATLWRAVLADRLQPVADLDRASPAQPVADSATSAQAAEFVEFLVRRGEPRAFTTLIDRVAVGEPFDLATKAAYASNARGLEFEWREQLRKRYRHTLLLLGIASLSLLALAAMAWSWRRHRLRSQRAERRCAPAQAVSDSMSDDTLPEVRRIKLIPRPPSPPPFDTAPGTPARQGQPDALESPVPDSPVVARSEIPKVEHDGLWHTLH